MSAKKKQRKATGMVMEEVNENFREGQDEEAKINIVVGMPKIDSISPQISDETSPVKQNQIPLDPPQQSAPQPEVLHSGRISLRRGVEQKVIEDSVNNSLSPMKSRNMKETDVYERLYSDHQEKLIKENLTKSAAAGEFIGSNSPQQNKAVAASSSPRPPRVYTIASDLRKKREEAADKYIKERIKEGYPQIDEVSRQLAERIDPTEDRRAFHAQYTIVHPLRRDLTLEERSKKEIDKNHYTFHPQITTLDPSILASPSTLASAVSAVPNTSTSASSISTPLPKQREAKQSSGSLPTAGTGAGQGRAGAGEQAVSGETVQERLQRKGREMEERREARRKKYSTEDTKECRDPHICHHSLKLIPEGSTHMKRYKEWIHLRDAAEAKAAAEAEAAEAGAGGANAGGVSGANTDHARAASAGADGAGTVDAEGVRTLRRRNFMSASMFKRLGERETWMGNTALWGRSREDEELKECTHTPQIIHARPHPSDLQEWIEKTYGVKRFIERSELARRLKEERPPFNPERKYPPPPTKFQEFNLTKTKKELEKEDVDT